MCAVMERYKKITTINSDDLVQTEKRKTIKELIILSQYALILRNTY